MDRRRFLVGLGTFAGTALMWKPESAVFDMARESWRLDAGLWRQRPAELALDVMVPAYGSFWISPWFDSKIVATATPVSATIDYATFTDRTTTRLTQPVVDGRANFILPTGEGLRLRVY